MCQCADVLMCQCANEIRYNFSSAHRYVGTSAQHVRLPPWIRVPMPGSSGFLKTNAVLRNLSLHTVCEEARCPNIGECFHHGTATFMILGDICTRACGFCHVGKGRPGAVDFGEPERLARAVLELGMKHVVITSPDRDDLPDKGAGHFAAVVHKIKEASPQTRVEALTPDFQGDVEALRKVVHSPIEVFNHNLETVPRLYRKARRGSRYERSLAILESAKKMRPGLLTKSGLMLGLGETILELLGVLRDLRNVACDILTLGQYLRPSLAELAVERFASPEEFRILGEEAARMGFRHVESGPLVRSSYHAWKHTAGIVDRGSWIEKERITSHVSRFTNEYDYTASNDILV